MTWLVRISVCVFLLAGGWRAFHQLVGYEITRVHPTPEGLQEAIEWDRQNPDPYYLLGLLHRDRPEHFDLERSRSYLEQTVQWNRYYWPYWIDLARAYDISKAPGRARDAYQKAVEINPQASVYRWRFANFLLREGDQESALRQFKRALELEPSQYLLPTLSLLWKVEMEAETILSIWPDGKYAGLKLMQYLAGQENVPHDFMAGRWQELLGQAPDIREGDFYIRYLLEQGRFEEARADWERLAGAYFESEIWDGSFQRDSSGGTLGWFRDANYVSRVDEGVRIEFDGTQNIDFNGFRQQVVVEPGAEYELTFRARSEGLTTEQGLYFEIVADRVLGQTEQVLGTTVWTVYSEEFRIPPQQHLVAVQLRRQSSRRIDNRLRGAMWLESVQLRRVY